MYGPNIFTENVADKKILHSQSIITIQIFKGNYFWREYKQSKVTMRITLLGTYSKSLTNEIPAARGKNAYPSYKDKVWGLVGNKS